MSLRAGLFFSLLLASSGLTPAAHAATPTPHIHLDQFGYPPHATKIAVLADPQTGFNAAESYLPGPLLQVRRAADQAVVLSAPPAPWNGGATHAQSGDRVWWFDFSALTEPGEYQIYDPANDLVSDTFSLSETVYLEVLRHAVRMYFYQRSGFAKEAAFAGEKWTDAAAFLGPNQDPHCRPIGDPGNAALERDLRGGWFDAGDYNKYTEWAGGVVLELLLAYRQNPHLFTDDFGLPESGNGLPDLLDEIKWEMDWLLRMQEPSGALLGKVSVTEHQGSSPPSATTAPRYYGPVSTEATASGAAAFALGSSVFAYAGLADYAASLRTAALAAWEWCQANPEVQFLNTGFASVSPQTDSYGRFMNRLTAAVMLFAATGETRFRDFVDAHYTSAQPYQWTYFFPFQPRIQKALFHYCTLPAATPAAVANIRARMLQSIQGGEFLTAFQNRTDAYRAYLKNQDYVWGSNGIKGQMGMIYLHVDLLGLDPARSGQLREAAAGYLHYLHGVNPLGLVMLTHMGAFGAERSANEMYHTWFWDGTIWDHALTSPNGPAPGYLTGGPNPGYSGTAPNITNQPPQKAYRDWNTSWPENSWEITEPSLGYQSSYIHLLSHILAASPYAVWSATFDWAGAPAPQRAPHADADGDGLSNFEEFALHADPLQPGGPPPLGLTRQGSAWEIRFAHPRPGLPYTLLASPDLAQWSPTADPDHASLEELRWTVPASAQTRFFRLTVAP